MKKKVGKWLLSLVLSLAMIAGLMSGLSIATLAEVEPDWPQLKDDAIDVANSSFEWAAGVTEGFTSNVVDYEIINIEPELLSSSNGTTKFRYNIGEIIIYVDKLPTQTDMVPVNDQGLLNPGGTVKIAFKEDGIEWHGHTNTTSQMNLYLTEGQHVSYENGYVGEQMSTPLMHMRYYSEETGTKITYYYSYGKVTVKEKSEPTIDLSISNGSAIRNSKASATISINTSEASTLYYSIYDVEQTDPVVDTTGNGISLTKGSNSFDITGLTNGAVKYLYVVAKSGTIITEPLEIIIPEIRYDLLHEKQIFPGFAYGSDFYTERFTNASGESITSAVPGETVTVELGAFETDPNYYISYSEGAFTKMGIIKRVLTGWEISADTMDNTPGSDVYSFTFTMPEHDVTVKALTEEAGVPIKKSENFSVTGAKLHLNAYKSEEYGGFAQYTTIDDISKVIPGTEVVAWAFLNAEGYVLDTINVLNHGEPVDESKIDRDIDFAQVNWAGNARTIVEEGGDYTFEFVFRPRSFAEVTVVSSDALMGSAEGSVESGTLALVFEGQTVTLTATPNEGYVLKEWQVKDDNGTTIPVTVDTDDPNKASFVMTADYSDEITATAVFEVIPADYSAVDAAIDKANKVDASLYTEESVAALRAAVEAVVPGKPVTEQAAVDKMAKDIEDAIAALVISPAVDAIETIEDLPAAEDLTLEDKEDVMAAKEAYDALIDAEKAKVDPLIVKDLDLAVATIEKLEAEKIVAEQNAAIEALQKQIEELKAQLAKTPGWHTNEDGSKYFCDNQGEKVKGWLSDGGKWYFMDKETGIMTTGWVKENGKWYFMDKETGIMATGWVKDEGTWYYMNTSGAMQTGWLKDGNTWYYLKSSGAMAANEWCEGYWLNANGSWTYQPKGSWKQNSTGWWFGDTSGWYAKSTVQKIDGVDYTFDAAGYWVQ